MNLSTTVCTHGTAAFPGEPLRFLISVAELFENISRIIFYVFALVLPLKSAQLAAMWRTCNAFDSDCGQNCLSWITPTFPSEARSSGESVITAERGGFHHAVCIFVMVCVREPRCGLAAHHGGCVRERMNTCDGEDAPSCEIFWVCVVHTFPGQFTKSNRYDRHFFFFSNSHGSNLIEEL